LELRPGEVTNNDYVMTRDLTASNFEIHAGITGSFGMVPEKSHFIDYCYLSVPPKVQMSKVDTRNETLVMRHYVKCMPAIFCKYLETNSTKCP